MFPPTHGLCCFRLWCFIMIVEGTKVKRMPNITHRIQNDGKRNVYEYCVRKTNEQNQKEFKDDSS